ncbi:MAG TPA: hypothetical protein DDZ41_09610 [Flavobacterium sp.]|nr:hypothetical protein [Flavobacterium sp.]
MATIGKYGKVIFSDDDIQFLKDNFKQMTNKQIAVALQLKPTIVRMKAYEMGLQRMNLESWPHDAVLFLKENYHKIGNQELCRIFDEKFPKNKKWTSKHIQKKMHYLNLKRNKLNLFLIKEKNRDNGSFGKRNLKNNPPVPKVYFYVNEKTRVEIRPGQSTEQLKQKYSEKTK